MITLVDPQTGSELNFVTPPIIDDDGRIYEEFIEFMIDTHLN